MNRLFFAAGAIVDRIKINAIAREVRDGKAVWIKRRRMSAAPLMRCANAFFGLAHAPLQAIACTKAWQRWEVESFLLLHGSEGFRAFREGTASVGAEEMPGINLTCALDSGGFTPKMSAAAARELRRAHLLECEQMKGGWSHGDPHIGNFIYEESQDRARLIDFEVMHDLSLSADERHADDLLVFLQDMAGRISAVKWKKCAYAFVMGYDRPEITRRLIPKLTLPSSLMPRVWWLVRTTFLPPVELVRRLSELRAQLSFSTEVAPPAEPYPDVCVARHAPPEAWRDAVEARAENL